MKGLASCLVLPFAVLLGMTLPVNGQGGQFQKERCSDAQIDSMVQMGEALLNTTHRDSATQLMIVALDCSRALGDSGRTASTLLLLGRLGLSSFTPEDATTKYLLEALSLFKGLHDTLGIIRCNLHLGVVNFGIKNYETAVEHFERILHLHPETESYNYKITSQYLIALCYSEMGVFDKAAEAFEYVENEVNPQDTSFLLQVWSFKGKMYLNNGQSQQAEQFLSEVAERYKPFVLREGLSPPFAFLAHAYFENGNLNRAKHSALQAYRMALGSGAQTMYLLESLHVLHQVYDSLGAADSAYFFLSQLRAWEELQRNERVLQRIAQMSGQFEFDQQLKLKEAEQALKDQEAQQKSWREKIIRNALILGLVLVLIAAYFILRQRNRIGQEKQRSESLLLNILPEKVAQELKEKGEAEARLIDQATVLFTDFKGFTNYSENVSPKELVRDLHESFSAFDKIISMYKIEKIKTIGDAYMAAGGLPIPNESHAKDVVCAALEIAEFIAHGIDQKKVKGKPYFEIRIGVHTGPVVAGIVGLNKFSYDIWGDTVNTASRMESAGEVGKVNISQATYELIKDCPEFAFENRGKIEAKGKGEMEMWFVSRA